MIRLNFFVGFFKIYYNFNSFYILFLFKKLIANNKIIVWEIYDQIKSLRLLQAAVESLR
jgi:hypothetical protein